MEESIFRLRAYIQLPQEKNQRCADVDKILGEEFCGVAIGGLIYVMKSHLENLNYKRRCADPLFYFFHRDKSDVHVFDGPQDRQIVTYCRLLDGTKDETKKLPFDKWLEEGSLWGVLEQGWEFTHMGKLEACLYMRALCRTYDELFGNRVCSIIDDNQVPNESANNAMPTNLET